MRQLEPDQRLAGSRQSCQRTRRRVLVRAASRAISEIRSSVGRVFSSIVPNPADLAVLEQLPGCLDERRQRSIRRWIEEAIELDRRTGIGLDRVAARSSRTSGPNDLNARLRSANVARCIDQDERRLDLSIGALAVVAAKVTRIRGCLIDIDTLGASLALELEDKDGPAEKQDNIRPPGLHWELVLEDRRVVVRLDVRTTSSRRFSLQLGIESSQARICWTDASRTNAWRELVT